MKSFESQVRAVISDHTHGSTFLLKEILHLLHTFNPSSHQRKWAFRALREIDPAMRIVHHFLQSIESASDEGFDHHLKEYLDQWQDAEERITRNLIRQLPAHFSNLLTHSHSGVVTRVIRQLRANGFRFHIWQTESHPGGEGILQADTFRQQGFEVHLLKDQHIHRVLGSMDLCLLGTDQYDRRCFLNKQGSGEIVKIAAAVSCPVYVLGDTRKATEQVRVRNETVFEVVSFQSHVHLVTEVPV